MPLFIWKPSYDVGVPEIDLDHRQLVGLINALYEAMKMGHGYEIIKGTIDQLLTYARQHFETEESFMRANNYPHMADHEKEHELFREQVAAMNLRCEGGRCPPTIEVMTFLCDWLRNHVTTSDKELGRFLKRVSEQAGKHSSPFPLLDQ